MPDDFSIKYTFNEQEFNDAFDTIMIEKLSNKVPYKNKSAYILGGQPGAGKSSLVDNILNEKFNGNAIVISGDDFRRYHPKYDEIQKNEDKLAAKYTQNFSSKITEKLIENASNKGYNLIVEGTFRTDTTPIKTLSLLKDKGYNTNIAIKACDKDISWQSCLERYEKQKQVNPLTARYTTKEDHDIVIKNLSENSAKVFETGLANSIQIQNRQGQKTEINFDKNLAQENSNKIKNLIENEINGNQKTKEEPKLSLTITSTENLRPELQNLFKKDIEINKNDEVSLLLKTLEHTDKIIELKNNQEMKFPNPNEKIGLNLKTDDGKNFDLNVPMGSGNFSKGLGHLIAIGNQDLKRDTFNKDNEKRYVDIIEKTGKGHEQKPSEEDLQKTNSFFDKVFNGGLQSLEAAASIGGEEIKDFTNSFIKGFKILDIKTEPKTITPKKPDINKAMANDLKMIDAKSKEAFEKMQPQKEREKEITNHKSLGISK